MSKDIACADGHRLCVSSPGLSVLSPDFDADPTSVVLRGDQRRILAGQLTWALPNPSSAPTKRVWKVSKNGHHWAGVHHVDGRWALVSLSPGNPVTHRWSGPAGITVIAEYHRPLVYDPPPGRGAAPMRPYLVTTHSGVTGVGVRGQDAWSVIGLDSSHSAEHTDNEVTPVACLELL